MTMRTRPPDWLFVLALAIGALVGVSAWADDPCAVPPPADSALSGLLSGFDPLVQLLTQGAIASALIIAGLLWLRRAFPSRLAPEPATEASRLWNLGIALGGGLLLGVATVAPAIPIPGREPVGAVLWVGRVLGGFLAATAAVFGRDFITRGRGVLEEAAERKKIAATMTTGQFRALRDGEAPPDDAGFTTAGFLGTLFVIFIVGALAYLAVAGLAAEVP
jgi:hypothetical protein